VIAVGNIRSRVVFSIGRFSGYSSSREKRR